MNVQTYWGGWGGLNSCVVEEEMPPLSSQIESSLIKRQDHSEAHPEETHKIDLSNFKPEDLSQKKFENHRYDYAKYCVHRHVFRYAHDYEYPTIKCQLCRLLKLSL